MVHGPMTGFVSSDVQEHVTERCVVFETVVLFRFWCCLHLGPDWKTPFVEAIYCDSVCVDCFFFKITNKSVSCLWRNEIESEKEVVPEQLSNTNSGSHKDAWLTHGKEEE